MHHIPAARRAHVFFHRRKRKPLGFSQVPHIRALRLGHFAEFLKRFARLQCRFRFLPRVFKALRLLAEPDHVCRKLQTLFRKVFRPASVQRLQNFQHLQGVAHGVPKRPVHIGDERRCAPAGKLRDLHHFLGERNRVLRCLHKGAAARLHVQQNTLCAGGDLLAHDARSDERHALHRPGHVAQRVKLLVRRAQLARLSDHRAPDLIDLRCKFFRRKIDPHTGNALKLIRRAARVSKPAAAHLGNLHPARRANRHNNHARLVTHAARGMLIYRHAVYRGKVGHVAGMRHRQGQLRRLLVRHAV